MIRRNIIPFAAVIVLTTAACLFAEPTTQPNDRAQQLIDRGLNYLKQHQKPDGGWQNQNDPPAVTALVLRAFVRDSHYNSRTDFIAKGYDKLFTYQLDTGGVYEDMLANYNTA